MLELVKFGSGFTQIERQMILDRTKNALLARNTKWLPLWQAL
jgi:hypothetical protein